MKRVVAFILTLVLLLSLVSSDCKAAGLNLDSITVVVGGISRPYQIIWVSDIHEGDSNDYNSSDTYMKERQIHWNNWLGLQLQQKRIDVLTNFITSMSADAVILGGDIVDYNSSSNYATLNNMVSRIASSGKQVMQIDADHDYSAFSGGRFGQNRGAKSGVEVLDFGEFAVLGINDSTNNITEAQVATISGYSKPVIIATHVPYASRVEEASLNAYSQKHKGKTYYWSNSGTYSANGTMQSYLNKFIYSESTNVVQVLAGHMHGDQTGGFSYAESWDGALSNKVRQHVFAAGLTGTIGVINVIPGSTKPNVPTTKPEDKVEEKEEDDVISDAPAYTEEVETEYGPVEVQAEIHYSNFDGRVLYCPLSIHRISYLGDNSCTCTVAGTLQSLNKR